MKFDWQDLVREFAIEVLALYPDRDPKNPSVLLDSGKAYVRIGKLKIEIRGIAYGKRRYGKQGGDRKRWFVKRFGDFQKNKKGEKVFIPTVAFFEGHFELWKSIEKLILKTIKNNPLPHINKARIFPFGRLPDRVIPAPPGEPCYHGEPWNEVAENFGLLVTKIFPKKGVVPEAGTKEKGTCHVFLPPFGIELGNICYRTNPEWRKDFLVSIPMAKVWETDKKKIPIPSVIFLEKSRLIWRAIAKLVSKEVGMLR